MAPCQYPTVSDRQQDAEGAVLSSIGRTFSAFRSVTSNRALLRLEGAAAGSVLGLWAFGVALSVFAFRNGGASSLGLLILLRLLPAVFVAPLAGIVADRYRRELVMIAADLSRAVVAGAAAIAVAMGASVAVVFLCAILIAVLSSVFRPAESAIMPSLARTPEELTAANALASTIDSAGVFVGPALGGLLLAFTSTSVVLAATAVSFVWSAALIAGIRTERRSEGTAPSFRLPELVPAFRAVLTDRRLRLVTCLLVAQNLVSGAMSVLIVAAALDLLDMGPSGVGYLTSALGTGGLIGAAVALSFAGKERLMKYLALGVLLVGLSLAGIGIVATTVAALVFFGLSGLGETLVEVTARTLLQRTVADEILGRVFGLITSMVLAAIGLGAVAVPVLIETVGLRGALVGTGLVLPALLVVLGPSLAAADAGVDETPLERELLRVPIFSPLPAAALAAVAPKVVRITIGPGEPIFEQGDPGDRFYVIQEGTVEISVDGQAATQLGPGDFFGEIALLRTGSRTASASSSEGAKLLALERDHFLAAVTGNPESQRAADAAVAGRLAIVRPAGVSV
jgi:MFS family permease